MDPNAALLELRKELAQEPGCYSEGIDCEIDINRVIELFNGLDQWLSSGGFMPEAWAKHRRATL